MRSHQAQVQKRAAKKCEGIQLLAARADWSTFDPDQWLDSFLRCTSPPVQRGKLYDLRLNIQALTLDAFLQRRYFLPSGEMVPLFEGSEDQLCEDVRGNQLHTRRMATDEMLELQSRPGFGEEDTSIRVVQGDCLAEALRLQEEEGLHPAVLNMASAKQAGACFPDFRRVLAMREGWEKPFLIAPPLPWRRVP